MQVEMDARGWSKRFRFPGYDGALPKAVRSSRGRSKYQHKSSKTPSDWGLFDLLATVAGQMLQDKNINEETTKRQSGISRDTGNAMVSNDTLQYPQCGIIDKPIDKIDTIKNKKVEDFSLTLKAVNKLVDEEASEVAVSVENQLNLDANVLCVDRTREATDTQVNLLCSKVIESNNIVSKVTNLEMLESGDLDVQMHSEGHEDSDTNCSIFKGSYLTEAGSCVTIRNQSFRDKSPPFLGSGSSDEELTSVHTQHCDILNKKASEKNTGFRQDIVLLEANDDDDKFSVSVVLPKSNLPQSSPKKPLGKISHEKERLRETVTVKTAATGFKRKVFQTGGLFNKKCCNNVLSCSRQLTARFLQANTKRSTLGSSDLCSGADKSSTRRSDAKDASVGSSRPKAAWRNAKNNIREPHVKVNITSFKVPELSIDLPKTATVANLKRAVMDAAINLLGGGLHVRVLHQGKKVADENTTLVQMGISCRERLDSLAFMLEPDRLGSAACIEDPLFGLSNGMNQTASWYPAIPLGNDTNEKGGKTTVGKLSECVKMDASDNLVAREQSDEPGRGLKQYSHPHESPLSTGGPLILHSGLKDNEIMDILTPHQSFQGLSAGKRRTRRPFSVMEVTALVQAVELLGTGRWREVKQQAFDHARHRTYVDLKDKWKTLVHTAHIAPHQRRGEPVPQELLDRVLKAHTYWAAQQAKQQKTLGM